MGIRGRGTLSGVNGDGRIRCNRILGGLGAFCVGLGSGSWECREGDPVSC